MQNTNLPYKVILNIPYHYRNNNNEEYQIPENLLKLAESDSRLVINRIEKDLGPIVNVVGVLGISKDPEDILIICDDDQVYHEDMLEYHLKKMAQYPDSVIAFRGDLPVEKREWEEDGVKKYMMKNTHFYFPVKHDSWLVVPGHWHSVGYKRKFFKDDFLNEEFLKSSENNDILIGYYMKKNERLIVCASWDKETDWRPVNDMGRPSHSFPIIDPLPYPNSGFYEFRMACGDGYGRSNPEITGLIGNYDIIYFEK